MATDSKPNLYVLGFSIGVSLALAILVSVRWFPRVWDSKYKQLRDFLFFSAFLFIILIRRYGRRCWVPRFWLALAILAIAHSAGCWLYITRVGGLRPIQLILIVVVETFPAIFFIKLVCACVGRKLGLNPLARCVWNDSVRSQFAGFSPN
jgi:hypothetical protein